MKRLTRLLAFLLSLFLLFPLVSCANSSVKVESGYLLQNGEKTQPEWVVKLGDHTVSFAEYRHFYLNAKVDVNVDFEKVPSAEAGLKKTVLSYLREAYAVELLAKEYAISLNEDEKAQIRKEAQDAKSEYGSELYTEMLNNYFLTEELYEKNLFNNALYDKTFKYLTEETGTIHLTDAELEEYLNKNFFCYAQTYVDFRSGEGTNTHTATDAFVKEITDRLSAGDDFYAVAFAHSDDQTMIDYKNGYLAQKNSFDEEKLEVLDALSENEISEPLLQSDGYYIFKRMPIGEAVIAENRDYLLNGYENANGEHVNGIYENRFYDMVVEKANAVSPEFADCYEAISTKTLF